MAHVLPGWHAPAVLSGSGTLPEPKPDIYFFYFQKK
jgi:hypothetical protein